MARPVENKTLKIGGKEVSVPLRLTESLEATPGQVAYISKENPKEWFFNKVTAEKHFGGENGKGFYTYPEPSKGGKAEKAN